MICTSSHRLLRVGLCTLGLYFLLWGCGPKNLSLNSYTLANQLYDQGKYERAAQLYTDFLIQDPQHPLAPEAIFQLGKIYQLNEQYQRAMFYFDKLITQYPQATSAVQEAKLEVAICLFHLQRYSEAIPLVQTYLSSSPPPTREAEAIGLLADSYFALGEYHQAFGEYELLKVVDPQKKEDPRILYQLSLCQIHLKKEPEQAKLQLNSLLSTKFGEANRTKIYQSLAQANLILQQPLEAIDNLLKARQYAQAPQEIAQAEEQIATLIHNQLTHHDLQALVKKWAQHYPADLALIQLGQLFKKQHHLSAAKQVFEQFLTSFPGHPSEQMVSHELEEIEKKLVVGSSKIGCIVPTSGDFAAYGDKILKGIKLAVEEYNLHNHTNIQLVLMDSRGNPEYAKNGARILVEKEQVAAIIGPLLSAEAYALSPVIDELKVCTITPTAAGSGIAESSPYFFRNCLTNQQQGKAIARYAVNTLQLKRFGIFHPQNPYGVELMHIFSREVQSLGATVEIVESYQEGETDFRPQLERINRIHPEGLFIPGYPEEIILIAPQISFYAPEEEETSPKQQGAEQTETAAGEMKGYDGETASQPPPAAEAVDAAAEQAEKSRAIQLLGCDGWYSEKVISQAGESVEGAIFTAGFFKESQDPLVQEFIKKYRRKYGQMPDILAAQAYDTANILLLALLSERLTKGGLRQALSEIRDFAGVTGPTSFSPSGEAIKKIFILTIQDRRFICLP
ncbi:MAG: penicillin-binding protein activator [bacterium]|nr:penicillin-binding protein activator [bacterium]